MSHNKVGVGNEFVQQPHFLPRNLSKQRADARHVATRAVVAGDETSLDRVTAPW